MGVCMSSELNTILNEVAVEEYELRKKEFEEGMSRYKSLLVRIAEEKKLDIAIMVEGTDRADYNKNERDLNVLEKAHLVDGETKYTHRNIYRQYKLTVKGAELVEKLKRRLI